MRIQNSCYPTGVFVLYTLMAISVFQSRGAHLATLESVEVIQLGLAADDDELAKQEFKNGKSAYDRYDYVQAIVYFKKARSYLENSRPIIQYYLVRSYYNTFQFESALKEVEGFFCCR